MKINYGCGRQVLHGFVNIDAVVNPKALRPPEILHAMQFRDGRIVTRVPLDDSCADELHAYHVVEHFYRYDVDAVVGEWKRLLKAGGLLVLELPNLEAACRNLLAGDTDQMCMWPIYGDWSHRDPYMMHRHGYTPATIRQLLESHGFAKVKLLPPKTHGARANRDMRVEAIKI